MTKLEILETVHLPTNHGTFEMSVITFGDELQHVVLERAPEDVLERAPENVPEGLKDTSEIPLVRIHSECMTGDIFGSHRCDCGEQLEKSLEMVGQANHGFIFYLRQEGRGIGLLNKLKSYNLQEQGLDTIEANHHLGFEPDLRDYDMVAKFLEKRGINAIELITNNPEKCEALRKAGITVERKALPTTTRQENKKYKDTKVKKMGHFGH